MNPFLLLFLISLLILIPLLFFVNREGDNRANDGFIDEEGDHSYYDRHLIEKKRFRKEHPEIEDVRTVRRLFKKRTDSRSD